MRDWLSQIGDLLRAHESPDAPTPPARFLLSAAAVLGASYGIFMGLFAVRTNGWDGLLQLLSATIKLPLLFLLTVGVTFPSLYVFNTLLGSRLTFERTFRVVGAWIAIILAVAASLGPILGFFTISTESYPFIVLLNVALLGLSGSVGCASLMRMLRRAERETHAPATEPPADQPTEQFIEQVVGPPRPVPPHERFLKQRNLPTREEQPDIAHRTLQLWIVIFGAVGLQMAWVLRPFIGAPGTPFSLFRDTQSNGFAAVARVIGTFIGLN